MRFRTDGPSLRCNFGPQMGLAARFEVQRRLTSYRGRAASCTTPPEDRCGSSPATIHGPITHDAGVPGALSAVLSFPADARARAKSPAPDLRFLCSRSSDFSLSRVPIASRSNRILCADRLWYRFASRAADEGSIRAFFGCRIDFAATPDFAGPEGRGVGDRWRGGAVNRVALR